MPRARGPGTPYSEAAEAAERGERETLGLGGPGLADPVVKVLVRGLARKEWPPPRGGGSEGLFL